MPLVSTGPSYAAVSPGPGFASAPVNIAVAPSCGAQAIGAPVSLQQGFPAVDVVNGQQIVQDPRNIISLNALMPASWKPAAPVLGGPVVGPPIGLDADWCKYAPTKEAFQRYVTASGASRLAVNSRGNGPLSRQIGQSSLLRSAPAVPLSAADIPFGGSSARQDLIAGATGIYPVGSGVGCSGDSC